MCWLLAHMVYDGLCSVWTGTWNMAGKKPPSSGYRLDDWLLANGNLGPSIVPDCDIYALGLVVCLSLMATSTNCHIIRVLVAFKR
jgi:hypothetical protein